jgi:hypothetical protein
MNRFKRNLVILCALWVAPARSQNTAASLNLNQTWTAPFPASLSSSNTTVNDIRQSWSVPNSYFFGEDNVAFVADPFNSTESNSVLQILYNQGSFATRNSSQTTTGGAEFYMQPFADQAFDKALLSYQLAFDNNFPWNLGGKLPGIFGGKETNNHVVRTLFITDPRSNKQVLLGLAVLVVHSQMERIVSP